MKRSPRPLPSPALTPGRRRIFAAVTLLLPVLLLVALEGSLRLFHYGPDLSLFMTETLAGKPYLVMNPAVKGRYFSRVLFNPSTSPDYFTPKKQPGTFRIFCLGGSTTVGYPYWYNGSFSSFLRDRLHRLFPGKPVEIVNLGMTATNSFTVNDMAREVVDYEPDLIIVYDGHNEFYGALGVASNESPGRSRWISRLALRAVHWKTWLLLRDFYGAVRGLFAANEPAGMGATMMERLASGQLVPYGSDMYQSGLSTYRENLEELRDLCAGRHVPVILGSQVSNLRDLPPFVSDHPVKSSSGTHRAFDAAFKAAQDRRDAGRWEEALQGFRSAAAVEPERADVHYAIAQCLDTLGRKREAEGEYILARDYDELRFRMDSAFNHTLEQACTSPSFRFVDMESIFRAHSPDSLIGSSLIVEHLHPNARGFFLLAEGYAAAMRNMGLLAGPEEWRKSDTLNEDALWRSRCLTPLDERMAARRTEILTSGWPFRSAIPLVDAIAADDTLGQITEQVTRGLWNWLQAHEAAATYYRARGETGMATEEYRVIVNQLPLIDAVPWLTLAKLLIDQGRLDEARTALLSSLQVKPTVLGYRALGDIALRAGKPAEARAMYTRIFTFPQSPAEQVENGYLLALAMSQEGHAEEAAAQLLRVLAIRPDHQPSAALLARIRTQH